ncbi:MAG TPA: cupin domain-containing protein, partial [Caldimonas sp.]|nr:cupin domain-containing protein [Caldimonas sp.]
MDTAHPVTLLGGLSAAAFMRRHWQKKPLLVRGALGAGALPGLDRRRLFELAARDDVESRLVVNEGDRWSV